VTRFIFAYPTEKRLRVEGLIRLDVRSPPTALSHADVDYCLPDTPGTSAVL
jgi:hypothetical protein